MKGIESGGVRLILDTKGERFAEQKMQEKALHDRTGRPLSELQNIGAGDTERTGLKNTLSFVILVGKFTDILSHANLTMNSTRD